LRKAARVSLAVQSSSVHSDGEDAVGARDDEQAGDRFRVCCEDLFRHTGGVGFVPSFRAVFNLDPHLLRHLYLLKPRV
jgi:hypothetical protein